MNDELTPKESFLFYTIIFGLIVLLLGGIFFGYPIYKVWSAEKEGQAEFARAEQNRQIAVQEAKAKMESAELLAKAEITRAKGLAEANRIVADSLNGKSEYIHYLWIEALKESKNEVIYIPTEAGIPVTESFRLAGKQLKQLQLQQENEKE
jgi:hypothetical protein